MGTRKILDQSSRSMWRNKRSAFQGVCGRHVQEHTIHSEIPNDVITVCRLVACSDLFVSVKRRNIVICLALLKPNVASTRT